MHFAVAIIFFGCPITIRLEAIMEQAMVVNVYTLPTITNFATMLFAEKRCAIFLNHQAAAAVLQAAMFGTILAF